MRMFSLDHITAQLTSLVYEPEDERFAVKTSILFPGHQELAEASFRLPRRLHRNLRKYFANYEVVGMEYKPEGEGKIELLILQAQQP